MYSKSIFHYTGFGPYHAVFYNCPWKGFFGGCLFYFVLFYFICFFVLFCFFFWELSIPPPSALSSAIKTSPPVGKNLNPVVMISNRRYTAHDHLVGIALYKYQLLFIITNIIIINITKNLSLAILTAPFNVTAKWVLDTFFSVDLRCKDEK